jgi:hypothetical protein
MKAIIVYESMYGNTHLIADAIAEGLRPAGEVSVLAVGEATPAALDGTDLVIIGAPTHVHSLPCESTRKAAIEAAERPGAELELDADQDAYGEGLREWFDTLGELEKPVGAFDTRIHMPAAFTGRASKGIARRLRKHGTTLLLEPESFFVTKRIGWNRTKRRARTWGDRLARTIEASGPE